MLRRCLLLSISLCAIACMKPNPLVDALADQTDESGTGTSDADAGSDADSDTPVSADLPADACESSDAFEPECGACLAATCCEQLSACSDDDDCMCLATCTLAGGNVGTCKTMCNGAKANEIAPLQPLLDCAAAECEGSC